MVRSSLLLLACTLAFSSLTAAVTPEKPQPSKPQPGPEKKPEPPPSTKKPDAPKPTPEPSKPGPAAPPTPPAPSAPPAEKPKNPPTNSKEAPAPSSTSASAKTTAPAPKPTSTSNKKKSVAEVTNGHQRVTGLFDFFLDREKGTAHLYVRKDQIGPEFIYFTHTIDGVVQAGHNRGNYGNSIVFRIQRIFDRLEFVAENTAFYFDPQNALSRSKKANISPAVLANESIVGTDEGGYIVNAGNLFLKENLLMVKYPSSDSGKAVLGRLSDTKTKFINVRGYPDNFLVSVEYVYENSSPTWANDSKVKAEEITDPRYVSIRVQHSLIKMPENDYKPRFEDPRIGYFSTQVTDMTSISPTPYRDVIHRWHLAKQKPGAALSEPVQPIVFWIENTTPVELRDTIREATLRWNQAFEKAGFKDAIVVKMQPDNANWDAGDINYNVLRWTSSPNPPFGGYGPSFVNPRTGQILGADIMLEFSFLTNRLRSQSLFSELGLASPATEAIPEESLRSKKPLFCEAASFAQQGLLFGQTTLQLGEASLPEMKALTREGLMKLILHEVGHTLGLNHNFRSSHLYDAITIHKKEITAKTGITGSVMDYMPANIAPLGTAQGEYYITKPGPYDHWAIEFGYSESLEEPKAEQARLARIASRSHEPALAFGNDADDMRRVGKGVDPRVMIYDMSSEPITYGSQRCELVAAKLKELRQKAAKPGQSWHPLLTAYLTLSKEASDALTAISRYVGGVQVERAFPGQAPDKKPYTPVSAAQQLAALQALGKYAFAPGALLPPDDLLAHLQPQRRGFDFFREDELPKIHDRIGQIQRSLLDHLLHLETQKRILDSGLYGNETNLDTIFSELTKSIFEGDAENGPDTVRQNLQSDYLDRLLRQFGSSSYPPAAQAQAFDEVLNIENKLKAAAKPTAHSKLLLHKIKKALEADS